MQARSLYLFVKDSFTFSFPLNTEVISVASFCGNAKSMPVLDLSGFSELRSFTTGMWCFHSVKVVVATGLRRLKSVVIGKKNCVEPCLQKEASCFRVVGCSCLESVAIGDGSFAGFHECTLQCSHCQVR